MLQNKKIICLIPARGGSKGIKFKNLRKINKKTLVGAAIDFAKKLNFLDCIIVSSENKKILNISKKRNCKTHIRNKHLSRDYASDTEIINSILKQKKYRKFDYLLYLQPTSPIRYKKNIIEALKKIIKLKADSIWSVSKISTKFHPLKVLKLKNKIFFENYLKSGKKIVARQQLSELYIRNGIFYIFSTKSFIKQKSIYLNKSLYYEIKYQYVNIDTKDELKSCRVLSNKFKLNL